MTAVLDRPRVAIDPRLRARRIAVRRDQGRRRFRRLLLAVGVLTVVSVAAALVYSPLLSVHRIDVRGAGTIQPSVVTATHIARGAPLLFVDAGAAAADIRRLPAVATARVERHFPNTVTVTVTLRAPVAWSPDGRGGALLIDGHGIVIARSATAPLGLPALVGLTKLPAPGGRVAPEAPAALAAALAPALPGRVASVSLGPLGLVVGVMRGPQLRFGDATALAAKARAAGVLLGALARPATYVDVSVPDAPVAG